MSVENLTNELKEARRQVVTDGYEMSLGELASMYKGSELVIDPNYQRLFRWDESQKTRFIESLLLGIPIPPIFVFQRESGVWELIDGLQRVSTVLQLMGELLKGDGELYEPLVLGGTNLLPSLTGLKWIKASDDDEMYFSTTQQLEIKRARIRVEILRKESDEDAKFELFQRLNTGGTKLSEQEVRNSVLVMLNNDFYAWLNEFASNVNFAELIQITDNQKKQQAHIEIALRFIAYRKHPYARGLDVNEYLDVAARRLARLSPEELDIEKEMYSWTFQILRDADGADAFKRWDGNRHVGGFLISAFDAIAYGVAINRNAIEAMDTTVRSEWLRTKIRTLWAEDVFRENSGSGVRGTTRLTKLLPFGQAHFTP